MSAARRHRAVAHPVEASASHGEGTNARCILAEQLIPSAFDATG